MIIGISKGNRMKDKILFFTDGWFLNFGVAKLLQEKYDCDLYAIISLEDKAKKFFQNQQLVKYEKIWYFLDHITTIPAKPDLQYLKSIEEKYGINLWKIAYTDRDFYMYNKFHKFTSNEILSILEQECRFFEKVLDEINPDFLSIYISITHYQELLCAICKGRRIRILMLGPARFGNRMMISEQGVIMDELENQIDLESSRTRTINELENYLENFDSTEAGKKYTKIAFETHTWERYKSILEFFFTSLSKNYKKRYYNFGRTRFRVFKIKLSNLLKKKYRYNFIDKHFLKHLDPDTNFIYFPLQVEPERILQINAPFYTNQLAVLTNIAKSVPVGYKIYVKEHPAMKVLGWRNVSYYKKIMDLPNVVLIHPSVNHKEIIKKSSLVITIAGTTGQEAAFFGKPVITFTKQLYSTLPSVFTLDRVEELPNAIKSSLQKKVNPTDLNKFIQLVEQNTFSFDLVGITTDFAYRFGFKGPVMDAELPISKVQTFLKEYESEFEQLTSEHLKKINQHKKHSIKEGIK